MRRLLPFVLLTLFALGLCQAAPVGSARVTDLDGAPLPARVTVVMQGTANVDGHVYFTDPEGFCRLEGCPTGSATVEATHGPEWSVEAATCAVDAASGETLTLRLRRLYDLPAHGYFQGDAHMHSTYSDGRQKPAEVADHCRCEGLHWAFLTDHESVAGQGEFMAAVAPGFLPLGGQEITTSMGHILGLGVKTAVSRDVSHGAEDMARIFRQIHEQGGLAVVAHPMSPTMAYLPWQVEGYDALEILNGSLPPYQGIFDVFQARLRWHALLNEGKRIPAMGDSDNHENANAIALGMLRDPAAAMRGEPRLALLWNLPDRDKLVIPWALKGLCLGTYRTVLKLDELSQPAIFDAIRASRGFVTNGPILAAAADGLPPGAELHGARAELTFDAVCNRGLERVVVVTNGIAAKTIELQGEAALEQHVTVPLDGVKWLTLECYGKWPDFATTNAWYVVP
jgi:hypothetical protein